MAVNNVSEMGARWAAGVQGKTGAFEQGFRESRQRVLEGLRRIGANPGPTYSGRVTGASPNSAVWASKVQSPGAQEKFQSRWLAAISR